MGKRKKKGSDLRADLACGKVDWAAALDRGSGPGADQQSDGLVEGPAHERMPHQRGCVVEL